LASDGNDPDETLLAGVGRGDPTAVRQLLDRRLPRILALARRMLNDPGEAEDVAQETFVTAFEIWDQLRDYERARAWLLQIAVRKVHRQFRKRRLLRLLGLDRNPDDLPLDVLARDDISAELRSDLVVLDGVLMKLPAQDRMAWMLRHVEGMPLSEVATHCDCSLATAKRRIASAHRVVERHLEIEQVSDD